MQVSIHLMLLFIRKELERARNWLVFQYISCYSLSAKRKDILPAAEVSIHLMLLFILFAQRLRMAQHCFNTSHVTLYPSRLLSVQCRRVFQYISCYSLSLVLQAFLLLTVFIIQQNTKDCKIFTNRHLIFYLLNQNLVYPRIFNIFHFFMKIRLVIFITFHLTYLRNSPVMFSH